MQSAKAKPRCPVCREEVELLSVNPTFPFCSPRCKRVDLSKWLGQEYVLHREPDVTDLMDMDEETIKALKLDDFLA